MSTNPDDISPEPPEARFARSISEIIEPRHFHADPSPSAELIRAIENYHRRNRLSRAANADSALHPRMPPDVDREPHRTFPLASDRFGASARSVTMSDEQSLPVAMESNSRSSPSYRMSASLAAPPPRRSRTRVGSTERLLERQARRGSGNISSSLQRTERQLEAASSTLRALLDDPAPFLTTQSLLDHEPPTEDEPSRRAKRRKQDSDKAPGALGGLSYGRYGQSEPGKLTMEIVSCDGGIYLDDQCGQYGAENVLRNDRTVYCTKGNRCNLILKHQGATPFCLNELIIKAPPRGFTAPVQEGMVFISMTSDDLLTRTALYQIQYSSPLPSERQSRERSHEPAPIMSIRHRRGDLHVTAAQARMRRLYQLGRDALADEEGEYRLAQLPSDFDLPKAPPFQVTIEYSDDDEEEDPLHSPPLSRPRAGGMRLSRSGFGPYEDDDSEDTEELELGEQYTFPAPDGRESASHITLAEAVEASQLATQEAVQAVGGELMAPHARFFIEQDKSKCSIKFEPPVSGRFILVKMWSPHATPSANIDIQSIVARGFAGPRIFPAVDLR